MASRSVWTLATSALVLACLAASLFLPWWTYRFSSGSSSSPAGPQGDNDSTVRREHISFQPFQVQGNATEAERDASRGEVELLGWLVAAATALTAAALGLEAAFGPRDWTRWLVPPFALISCLFLLAGLVLVWFQLPEALSGRGVDGAFTSKHVGTGFVRTNVDWGFLIGGAAAGLEAALAALKLGSGSVDLTAIEKYRTGEPRR